MKTACIYHSIDLDGWMSAAIVKHWFNKQQESYINSPVFKDTDINMTLDFLGFNYGNPIPDLLQYDRVIMCDISFPAGIMLNLLNTLHENFIWIDHHISAINSNKGVHGGFDKNFNGLQDTSFAACELTWKYFFPNESMPEIVRLLGRYDRFGHKGTNEEQKVLEFQYGARQVITNYQEAYSCLTNALPNTLINDIHNEGVTIYKYLCQDAKQSYKNGFVVWFDDKVQTSAGNTYKFICINKERFNPINFGIDYHKDGYDGAACFYFDGKQYNFSLYNDNGLVDCSAIAKQFGGGGHKGAAGFRLSQDQFMSLIK